MDEARRFLRYVIPGLVVLIQIVLILYLNDDLHKIRKFVDLGTAAIGFIASGIVGFIFSNLYYIIYWELYLKIPNIRKLDYLDLLENNKELFTDHFENKPKSQREAWPILNVYFNLNHGKKLKYFENKTDSISNILAGIGTTFVIVFFGLIIGEIFFINCQESKITYLLCNSFVLLILAINYQLAANILQNLYIRIFEWIKKHPNTNEKVENEKQ